MHVVISKDHFPPPNSIYDQILKNHPYGHLLTMNKFSFKFLNAALNVEFPISSGGFRKVSSFLFKKPLQICAHSIQSTSGYY